MKCAAKDNVTTIFDVQGEKKCFIEAKKYRASNSQLYCSCRI